MKWSISTTPYERAQLRSALAETQARRVLEIGCWKGETTALLSACVPAEGVVVAVDPMSWRAEILANGLKRHVDGALGRAFAWLEPRLPSFGYESAFWRSVRRSGRDNVLLLRSLSTDPTLLASPDPRLREFDVAFIDGDHSYEGVTSDLAHWANRIREGGRLLVHDAIPRFPGVCRGLADWARHHGLAVRWPEHDSLAAVSVDRLVRVREAPQAARGDAQDHGEERQPHQGIPAPAIP